MLGKKQLEAVLSRVGLMSQDSTLPQAFPQVSLWQLVACTFTVCSKSRNRVVHCIALRTALPWWAQGEAWRADLAAAVAGGHGAWRRAAAARSKLVWALRRWTSSSV